MSWESPRKIGRVIGGYLYGPFAWLAPLLGAFSTKQKPPGDCLLGLRADREWVNDILGAPEDFLTTLADIGSRDPTEGPAVLLTPAAPDHSVSSSSSLRSLARPIGALAPLGGKGSVKGTPAAPQSTGCSQPQSWQCSTTAHSLSVAVVGGTYTPWVTPLHLGHSPPSSCSACASHQGSGWAGASPSPPTRRCQRSSRASWTAARRWRWRSADARFAHASEQNRLGRPWPWGPGWFWMGWVQRGHGGIWLAGRLAR